MPTVPMFHKSSGLANTEGDRAAPLVAFLGRAKVKRCSAGFPETPLLWVRLCGPREEGLSSAFLVGAIRGFTGAKARIVRI